MQVFNCRSETRSAFRAPLGANPFIVAAAIGAQAVHVGAMFTPELNELLGIAPLDATVWLVLLPVAASVVAVAELYKALR